MRRVTKMITGTTALTLYFYSVYNAGVQDQLQGNVNVAVSRASL